MNIMKSCLFFLFMGMSVAGICASATQNRENVDVLSFEKMKDKVSELRSKALTTSDAEDLKKYFSAQKELYERTKEYVGIKD